MRLPSTELFHLIKSLSKTEKGYFIKYTSKHVVGEENDYLTLYRIIENQKVYDEPSIKAKIKSRAMLNRFAFLKHYLFNNILDSLYAYHLKSSPTAETMNRYILSDILFKKGLHASAFKETMKIKKYALENENNLLLLQCLNMQRTLLPFLERKIIKSGNISMESIRDEENKILSQLAIYYKVYHYSSVLFDYVKKSGIPGNKEELNKLNRQLNAVNSSPDFNEREMSAKTKQQYYHTMGFYYQMTGEDELSFEFRKKQVELMGTYGHKALQNTALTYAGAVGNLVITAKILKKYDAVEYYINIVTNFCSALKKPLREQIEWKIFSNTAVVKLNSYIQTAQFELFKDYLSECEKKLVVYKNKNDHFNELLINYFAAYYYFILADYKKCLHYISRITSEEKYKKLRAEVFRFSKIFEIIIHFKLSNYELANSLLKSALYQAKKKNGYYKLELLMLSFFKKEIRNRDKNYFTQIGLRSLKKEVAILLKNKNEQNTEEYFDISVWVDAEIQGVRQSEILAEKNKRY